MSKRNAEAAAAAAAATTNFCTMNTSHPFPKPPPPSLTSYYCFDLLKQKKNVPEWCKAFTYVKALHM